MYQLPFNVPQLQQYLKGLQVLDMHALALLNCTILVIFDLPIFKLLWLWLIIAVMSYL